MHFTENGKNTTLHHFIVSLTKSFQKLVLQVSSGFQRLENNKTTSKSKSKSKYHYVGKIVWDITPTLR